jgi:two-component system, NarL family, sensor kinase
MQTFNQQLMVFVFTATVIVFSLAALAVMLLLVHRKRQIKFESDVEALKLNYEKTILRTQVEIQEQTFAEISREIHDNINLSLTLAKLNLNMLDWQFQEKAKQFVDSSVCILSEAIVNLRDLSRSMNPVIIRHQGFMNAVRTEIERFEQSSRIKVSITIHGEPVFIESEKELVIFRILQESFANIIRHAQANSIAIDFFYNSDSLAMSVKDDGVGISKDIEKLITSGQSAGLLNMKTRALIFGGQFNVHSDIEHGTEILISIPY